MPQLIGRYCKKFGRFMLDRLSAASTKESAPLGLAQRGFCGFVEGAFIEVLHEGPLGRDPIAVRVNDSTIALRRREAMSIFVA